MGKLALPFLLALCTLSFLAGTFSDRGASAQGFPTARTLFAQELADIEGYEGQIIEVSLQPGARLGGHRHSGHMFVYVVEGEIVSQLEGGEKVSYGPGDFWYEHPMMLHADFFNPSETEPAKAVIFSVVETGKPQTILEPAHAH